MNPSALTSIKMAYEAGAKAALRGARIGSCYYKSPILIVAFEKGWRKFKEMEKK